MKDKYLEKKNYNFEEQKKIFSFFSLNRRTLLLSEKFYKFEFGRVLELVRRELMADVVMIRILVFFNVHWEFDRSRK